MRDYKQDVYDIIDRSYITCIPLEEFEDLKDLEQFVKVMSQNGIGVAARAEYSNIYNGVFIEAFDKNKCSTKNKEELFL